MLPIRAKYYLSKSQFVVILKSVIIIPSSSSATSWLPLRKATTTSRGDTSDGLSQSSKEALASSFKEWFKSRNDAVSVEIFKILRSSPNEDDVSPGRSADLALSNLGSKLNEALVLDVLKYGAGKDDVLSCLKFFDWAGRQPGFRHSRAMLYAIFKIISRDKLMSLMLDFLDSYARQKGSYGFRFHSTLVMGYAVAG